MVRKQNGRIATMPTPLLSVFFPIFPLIFFPLHTTAVKACSTYSCGGANGGDTSLQRQAIRFPFRAAASNQSLRCGYPGFALSCNNQNQPLLNLRSSGQFSVQEIDYFNQFISIADPDGCLAKRILNLNLSDSPFTGVHNRNFTFFKCTNNQNASSSSSGYPLRSLSCLSGDNYTFFAAIGGSAEYLSRSGNCEKIKTVTVPLWLVSEYPIADPSGMDLVTEVLQLSWSVPDCRSCEAQGGSCGFQSHSGLNVACDVSASDRGFPRGLAYGLILGIGIPGIVFTIGLLLFIMIVHRRRHRSSSIEFSLSIFRQPPVRASGLDGATIESYPTTVLGESRRLPEPCNDGICSICLSEYVPQETLRVIPECNHCFHAQCIDEWLRMKATCPLCRNSPEKPAVATASSTANSSTTRSTPENIDLEA
ncbi:hypothetical protein Ancab_015461 [Ancistrocladus abbreviatus]